jgi:hypothetical protein
MIPFHENNNIQNQDKYTKSLLNLLKTIHLYETTSGSFRTRAALFRDQALSKHNQDRTALGLEALTINDFYFGNKVIYKNN